MTSPTDTDAATGYLGNRGASTVAKLAANRNVAGSWVATFLPADLWPDAVEIYHIAVQGPNGNLDVYVDDLFYSAAVRSDKNEYDPKHPLYLRPGQTVTFHFSSAADPAPMVNIFAQKPQRLL